MRLVDTHCHLDPGNLRGGSADELIERARSAGVVGLVAIGVGRDVEPARQVVELAVRLPAMVSATVGVHPHDASTVDEGSYEAVARLAAHPAVVAVGEIGLDFHYDHSPRDLQLSVFERFVALARNLGKPIVVHTRSAPEQTLDVLESTHARDVGGIIHCFSEDRAFARRALDLGFFLSFSGIVTFKNATSVHDVAAWAPLDRILVETDSPYLAPVPFRGKPCEPAWVVHTARRLGELRAMSLDDVAAATTANAERAFRRQFTMGDVVSP